MIPWWLKKLLLLPVPVWRKQWQPTPVLLPGKSHGQRCLVGCSPWGRKEVDTTEQLHFHFSLSCIGEGNGNSLQCSCLENPRNGGDWWAAIYGVTQSRTQLKWLSSSSSSTCIGRTYQFNSIQLLSCVWLFATPWTATHQASLSITNSQTLLKLMSFEAVMPIQPSHPLSSPSPPTVNLSQHQGLFQWISSSHQVAKVLELHRQHQSFQWIFRTDFL